MGKRLLVAALCAAAVTGVGASGALAGEITGNGKWIAGSETAPLNGKSECAYSGRNDENVDLRPAQNLLRHASQEEFCHPRSALGPDHDQIRRWAG